MNPHRLRSSYTRPIHPRFIPLSKRDELDPAKVAESQQRDNGATRAFSSIQIKTSSGKCWFVDKNSGNDRANDTPVQLRDCDGSAPQKWDIITAGKHNNAPGYALIVSAYTQACLSFNDVESVENQVKLFSCGGRFDGAGDTDFNQIFKWSGGAGPWRLATKHKPDNCISQAGNFVGQSACGSSQDQLFTVSTFSNNNDQPGDDEKAPGGKGNGGVSTKTVNTAGKGSPTASGQDDGLATVTISQGGSATTVTVNKESVLNTSAALVGDTTSVTESTGSPQPSNQTQAASKSTRIKGSTVAGIVIGIVAVFLLITLCVFRRHRDRASRRPKRSRANSTGKGSGSGKGTSTGKSTFSSGKAPPSVDITALNSPPKPPPKAKSTPKFLSILNIRSNPIVTPFTATAPTPTLPTSVPSTSIPPTSAALTSAPPIPTPKATMTEQPRLQPVRALPRPPSSQLASSRGDDTETADSALASAAKRRARQRELERQMEQIQREISNLKNDAIDSRVSMYRLATRNTDEQQLDELRGQIKIMKEEISFLRSQNSEQSAAGVPLPPLPATPNWLNSESNPAWSEQPPPEYYRNSATSQSGPIPSSSQSQSGQVPQYS